MEQAIVRAYRRFITEPEKHISASHRGSLFADRPLPADKWTAVDPRVQALSSLAPDVLVKSTHFNHSSDALSASISSLGI